MDMIPYLLIVGSFLFIVHRLHLASRLKKSRTFDPKRWQEALTQGANRARAEASETYPLDPNWQTLLPQLEPAVYAADASAFKGLAMLQDTYRTLTRAVDDRQRFECDAVRIHGPLLGYNYAHAEELEHERVSWTLTYNRRVSWHIRDLLTHQEEARRTAQTQGLSKMTNDLNGFRARLEDMVRRSAEAKGWSAERLQEALAGARAQASTFAAPEPMRATTYHAIDAALTLKTAGATP